MRLLTFGSCNIDHVYEVAHIATPGETISSEKHTLVPGGKGLNQSIAAARAGLPVFFAGAIGNDGLFLRDVLQASGVDTTYLRVTETYTGHAVIQVDAKGENSILLAKGANAAITKEDIDHVLSAFSNKDYLLLQNEISNLPYLVERAYEKGMYIVLNPSPFDGTIAELDLAKINLLVLNETEAYALTGKKEKSEIEAYFRKNYRDVEVLITFGADGSCYVHGELQLSCPACRVEVVDTTAAGDTFLGNFLAAYAEYGKKGLSDALRYASAAAALAIGKKGAAESIPEKRAVLSALERWV